MKKHVEKREFADYICRPYCDFFKEGQGDEMACRGAVFVAGLVKRKMLSPRAIRGLSERRPDPRRDDPLLREVVCRLCPFVVDGCDFRALPPVPDAVPCGGFMLLGLLLDQGLIKHEKIKVAVCD